ncbi:hypothetical protein I204_02250 [Kwoniella mangroviensis CBS 8886]|uniref:hypothetical protein n=1 Tax=Kwoniella mangroviensis CBS 8507 TaxID=1296122 RepID=UPI00080D6A48|nr:uncharacterized protein I203_02381 [Kwoniella mangroviensis CBS 8507]OCF68986.1 hypothetical protein I203_02381 [Kwoniella mangroviensis CBS 8507]OCF76553.1 hypothetical protein I204_02250 [Kwoniella mangroviensis CBS 8886]
MTSNNDNPNKILLLHPPLLNPSSFLTRLTGVKGHNEPGDHIRWTIDNKYYTADVDIHCAPLSKTVDDGLISNSRDIDVIMYLFEDIPASLPPTLIKLLSTPRDIALAIRPLPSQLSEQFEDEKEDNSVLEENEGSINDVVDMLEEIGMEFVDEVNPLTEEDDERPMPPLEIIRQTLMTHLWPSMNRKPLNIANTSELPKPSEISGLPPPPVSSSTLPIPHIFPETFQPSSSSQIPPIGPSGSSFPDLEDIKREIAKADFGFDFDDIDKLDRLNDDFDFDDEDEDEDFGPAEEEYARLDDWLDSDDEDINNIKSKGDDVKLDGKETTPSKQDDLASVLESISKQDQQILHPHPEPRPRREGDWLDTDDKKFDPISSDLPSRSTSTSLPQRHAQEGDAEGFEDDFDVDEFTEYQTAPSTHQRQANFENTDMTLAMDPTPLLLHLQSVRAELAALEDPDERRFRAGKEVQQILASLGMGEMAGDDLGLDEI